MAEWKGRFSSNEYTWFGIVTAVKGGICVTLPDDLNNVHTTAKMTYDGWYRYGESTNLNFTSDEATGMGVQIGVVNFHGKDEYNSMQNIHFTVTNMTPSRIEGTYQSSNPSDKGTFYLVK